MIGRGASFLDTIQLTQMLYNFRLEVPSLIQMQSLRNPISQKSFLNQDLSCGQSGLILGGYCNSKFGKYVHDHQNILLTLIGIQECEIDGQDL